MEGQNWSFQCKIYDAIYDQIQFDLNVSVHPETTSQSAEAQISK